jgi:hypothetical protein
MNVLSASPDVTELPASLPNIMLPPPKSADPASTPIEIL